MIIYNIWWSDCDEGICMDWAGSMAEAQKIRQKILKQYKKEFKEAKIKNCRKWLLKAESWIPEILIKKYDFPTKKKDIIIWLKTNLNRDNG